LKFLVFIFLFACNSKDEISSGAKAPEVTPPQTAVSQGAPETPPETPADPVVLTKEAGVHVSADQSTLDRGKSLYMKNCLQCHNRDPNKKGPIGPEIVDAPLEVMISKIMTSNYPNPLPEGFTPKRKSHAMRAIPKLKDDIPAIHAWVQSVKGD
jgi:mono/diheme cytochrome c family protein